MTNGITKACFHVIFLLVFAGLIPAAGETGVALRCSLTLDVNVYDYSDYGEPPQIAIWLEHKKTGKIKTVFVTHRTANEEWVGKVNCPVSLPYWQSRNKNTPLADGVSGATPKKRLNTTAKVPKGSEWFYVIEVNVAGDYNPAFPSMTDDGVPDPQGNGQPSLIYRGEIKALPGQTSSPRLMGRTLQMVATDEIHPDLSGITDANKVLSSIKVSVLEK